MGIAGLLYILSIIIAASAAVMIRIFYKKWKSLKNRDLDISITDLLLNRFEEIHDNKENKELDFLKKHKILFLSRYIKLSQSTLLTESLKQKIIQFIIDQGISSYYIKRLNSTIRYRRCQAAVILGYISSIDIRNALKSRLLIEKKYSVKLYIANSMADIADAAFIMPMVLSLDGAPGWYRQKIKSLIMEFGSAFDNILPEIQNSDKVELQELIIDYAAAHTSEQLKNYLLDKAKSSAPEISHKAIETLCSVYFSEDDLLPYYSSINPAIIKTAIKAACHMLTIKAVKQIIPMLEMPEYYEDVIQSLSKIIFKEHKFISLLTDEFNRSKSGIIRRGIAEALSNKMEYFFVKLISDKSEKTGELVKEIFYSQKLSSAIVFLNKNKDIMLENYIIPLVREVAFQNEGLKIIFALNLNEKLAAKIGLEKMVLPALPERKEHVNRWLLILILFAAVFIFPVIFVISDYDNLLQTDITGVLKLFIYRYNYYFAYYFIAVNISYILLLLFSYLGAGKQVKYWEIKHPLFLFKKNIIPSISIIAPAFNEEANIIESVTSLLNLQYPDYEVIVVNDGSRDNTLSRLVNYFSLERTDIDIDQKIYTAQVRGLYFSKSIPNLLIIDKENGGKADSLNAGINVSRKVFFCGIDADSLLQSDSLLKIVSQFIDSDVEGIAAGGNIFPINGCTVEGGVLVKIGIPANKIARLQHVEYIRAFMGGRVGWAYLRSLLIISGAFGVFNKERVIEAGGYMTSRGPLGKDTVGEDMELVVRLALTMFEKKKPFTINYVCNANCWTEVPESYNILKRQRDRWHRGLLDIMTFHKRMLFNPKYGRIGLLASPYYLIFEVAGPWIELQGYIIFFISIILGLITAKIFLLLFTAGVMLGIFVTLSSFIIVEKEVSYFSFKDIVLMLFFAFIESFGIRQLLSLIRISAYVNILRKAGGWGKMVRRGFTSAASKNKV